MCRRPVGRSPVSMVYFSGCTARSALISSLIFLEARKVSLVKSLAMGADPLFLVRRFGVDGLGTESAGRAAKRWNCEYVGIVYKIPPCARRGIRVVYTAVASHQVNCENLSVAWLSGRASPSHGGGHRFKSCSDHHKQQAPPRRGLFVFKELFARGRKPS